jgi:hypothetical protein
MPPSLDCSQPFEFRIGIELLQYCLCWGLQQLGGLQDIADAGLSQSLHYAAVSVFQQRCGTYRTIVDNDYMSHREVYGELHRILVDEVTWPFCFLDIACGDAYRLSAMYRFGLSSPDVHDAS